MKIKSLAKKFWNKERNFDKESHYDISADSFVKNKIAYDLTNEIMYEWISKIFHADIMNL